MVFDFLKTLVLAAVLAALALVSGCTSNPLPAASHIHIQTPTQTIDGDFNLAPPPPPAPAAPALPRIDPAVPAQVAAADKIL